MIYPDFEKWRKNGRYSNSLKALVAIEDFYVEKPVVLSSVQTPIKNISRQDFFTFDEAIRFERSILIPNGWHIPTVAEWQKIILEFGLNDADEIRRWCLERNLNLRCRGYIREDDMSTYTNSPDQSLLRDAGLCGFYWAHADTRDDARYLYLYTRHAELGIARGLPGDGLTVRAIYS